NLGISGGDNFVLASGVVSFFVDLNTEVAPVFLAEFFTDLNVVFANTSGECDSVNTVHSSGVCTNVFCNAVGVSIQSNFSQVVTFFSSSSDISAVGGQAAAHAEQTGFLIEHVENFINGFVLFVADVLNNSWVQVTGTGTHDQTFQRGQTHGGVYTFAADGSGNGSTVTDVANDNLCISWEVTEFDSFFGNEAMAGTVEAVTTDAV